MSSFTTDSLGDEMSDSDDDSKVYTLLHYACSCGDFDIFDFVFKQCTRLSYSLENIYHDRNLTSESPLHFAVSKNNIEIVTELVKELRRIREQQIYEEEQAKQTSHEEGADGIAREGHHNSEIKSSTTSFVKTNVYKLNNYRSGSQDDKDSNSKFK